VTAAGAAMTPKTLTLSILWLRLDAPPRHLI
jgi:hypothetical protein